MKSAKRNFHLAKCRTILNLTTKSFSTAKSRTINGQSLLALAPRRKRKNPCLTILARILSCQKRVSTKVEVTPQRAGYARVK